MNSKESKLIIEQVAKRYGLKEEAVGEAVKFLLLSTANLMKTKPDKFNGVFPTIYVKGLGKFLVTFARREFWKKKNLELLKKS